MVIYVVIGTIYVEYVITYMFFCEHICLGDMLCLDLYMLNTSAHIRWFLNVYAAVIYVVIGPIYVECIITYMLCFQHIW